MNKNMKLYYMENHKKNVLLYVQKVYILLQIKYIMKNLKEYTANKKCNKFYFI